MHKGHEGDVDLPKPQANWRFPPDPHSHPEIERRDWSLREKADSQEWEEKRRRCSRTRGILMLATISE